MGKVKDALLPENANADLSEPDPPEARVAVTVAPRSVFTIEQDAATLDLMLADAEGELTPEIEAFWAAHLQEAAGKADNISAVYRHIGADVVAIDTEMARLTRLRTARLKAQASIEQLVDRLLMAIDKPRLEGRTGGTWRRRGNGGKKPMELGILDASELVTMAPEFVKQPPQPPLPPPIPDTATIRAALEEWDAAMSNTSVLGPRDAIALMLVYQPKHYELDSEETARAVDAFERRVPFKDATGAAWLIVAFSGPYDAERGLSTALLVPVDAEAEARDYAPIVWATEFVALPPGTTPRVDASHRLVGILHPRGYKIELKGDSTPSRNAIVYDAGEKFERGRVDAGNVTETLPPGAPAP